LSLRYNIETYTACMHGRNEEFVRKNVRGKCADKTCSIKCFALVLKLLNVP
jgi:hypothetical protein